MFAADQISSVSNGNAKSCIQALLKNREQHPLSFQRYPLSAKDLYSSSLLGSALTGNTGLSTRTHNSELSSDLQEFGTFRNSECSSPDQLENQKDFNYSQKLFHIADGNLYSIFSPIQGRSYGMKPSFLRKQKYTVQECHSRGRKNLRKGLKFHNFLPSESITSEKDGDFMRTKWRVHSECRLKEEHGTKQITISNWSQSVQDSPEGSSSKTESQPISKLSDDTSKPSTSYKILENESKFCDNIDPYDFNLSLDSSSECSESPTPRSVIEDLKTRNVSVSDSAKKEALNFVLNALMEKPTSLENATFHLENSETVTKPLHFNQKHRRKPLQTRRIVPYVKYLSLMEENNCVPLDLSSKCTAFDKSSDSLINNSFGNLEEDACTRICRW
ncbi:uncharacterized protein LOC129228473 [Uloborus diversus]|uniref:uncharacterized protein LOC129228473 n=1 Tax=Uloborus diversus TaxID=327109 RepID=UPI0024091AE2|nr:uncharacterized protein LOC129228473 [Uloborus diversus]